MSYKIVDRQFTSYADEVLAEEELDEMEKEGCALKRVQVYIHLEKIRIFALFHKKEKGL